MRIASWVVVLLGACSVPKPTFECGEWSDCGPGGVCEPNTNACSFADNSCVTGRRFSELSTPAYAGTCVSIQPMAGRAELCSPQTGCDRLRDCIDGRCVSVATLASKVALTCARCSLDPPTGPFLGGPIECWGDSSAIGPIPPTRFGLLHLPTYGGCATNALPCPAECEPGCPGVPPACPSNCIGADFTQAVTAGANHVCFSNARTTCFGSNEFMQLGSSEQLGRTQISSFEMAAPYDLIAAGERHTCGRRPFATIVECWGGNDHGQLDGTVEPGVESDVPRMVTPFPPQPNETILGVDYLAVSARFSCAASKRGKVRCWGTSQFPTGMQDLGSGEISDLDVGADHVCVIQDRHAVCWGANESGQAAPADQASLVVATVVMPDTTFVRIVTGRAHTCAVTDRGAIHCWGANDRGQLGTGAAPGPVQVIADPPVVAAITAGADHTCASHADDHVRCFGAVLERYRDHELCAR